MALGAAFSVETKPISQKQANSRVERECRWRWKCLGPGWDSFLNLKDIVGENTKNRLGARIIGIVTPANRNDPEAWRALTECDLAEFRADLWEPSEIVEEVRAFRDACIAKFGHSLDTIFTIRLEKDGGTWPDKAAKDREKIWLSLGLDTEDPPCEWIDVEVEAFAALSPQFRSVLAAGRVKTLASRHKMHGSYSAPDLRRLGQELLDTGANGVKLAVTCINRTEVLDLLAFASVIAKANPQACVLSMGDVGKVTRVLGPILGCPLTYGYLSGRGVAPGQLSVRKMREFYTNTDTLKLQNLSVIELLNWAEARLSGASLAK